jgi:hypothetical protein
LKKLKIGGIYATIIVTVTAKDRKTRREIDRIESDNYGPDRGVRMGQIGVCYGVTVLRPVTAGI